MRACFRCSDGRQLTRLGGATTDQGELQSIEDFERNTGLRDPSDASTDADHRKQVFMPPSITSMAEF